MTNIPVALVLGGVFPHILLINNLKRRGYYTILIDYTASPPAKEVADEHVKESILDTEKILQIARERFASLVVSTCLDRAIPVMAEVSQKLGLPCYIDPTTAHNVTNKLKMKELFDDFNIPTSKWEIISRQNQSNIGSLRFPVVTKQIAGTGSIGQVIIHEKEEFDNLSKQTFGTVDDAKILVEEFQQGRELSIDAMVIEGKCHLILMRERNRLFINNNSEILGCGSITPIEINKEQEKNIEFILQRIAGAFSLYNSPLMVQAIDNGPDAFSVIEIAARLGGGNSSIVNLEKTGFDMQNATLSCMLNETINFKCLLNQDYFASAFIYASEGKLDHFSGFDKLISDGLAAHVYFIRSKGDILPRQISAKNRVAAILIRSSDKLLLKQKSEEIFDRIDVISADNSSMLIKNIAIHHML